MRGSAFVAVLAGLTIAGCQPDIGDGCGSSSDCAINAERICDTTQPGGYCTIQGCDPDSCPGNSVCVEWRFVPGRLTSRFCMSRCNVDGDCRGEYACYGGLQFVGTVERAIECVEMGYPFARVIDIGPNRATAQFCAAVEGGPVNPPTCPPASEE